MICCGLPLTLPSGPVLSKTRLMTFPGDRLPGLFRVRGLFGDLIMCRCLFVAANGFDLADALSAMDSAELRLENFFARLFARHANARSLARPDLQNLHVVLHRRREHHILLLATA